ncbi:MAG: hypothetical protein KGH98_03310 [Candidatus Micrarchaeota archaeon]|nr:hypothetical protein [Candidatus Micrarchaeota archaeon]
MEKGPPATAIVTISRRGEQDDPISREARSISYNLSYYLIRGKNTKLADGIELTERFTKVLKGLDEEIYRDRGCPREKLEKFAKISELFRDLTKVISVKVNTTYRVPMELVKARGTIATVFISLVSTTEADLKAKVDQIRLDADVRKPGAFSRATISSKEPALQTYIEKIRDSFNESDKVFASAKIIKAPKCALLIR